MLLQGNTLTGSYCHFIKSQFYREIKASAPQVQFTDVCGYLRMDIINVMHHEVKLLLN